MAGASAACCAGRVQSSERSPGSAACAQTLQVSHASSLDTWHTRPHSAPCFEVGAQHGEGQVETVETLRTGRWRACQCSVGASMVPSGALCQGGLIPLSQPLLTHSQRRCGCPQIRWAPPA